MKNGHTDKDTQATRGVYELELPQLNWDNKLNRD